jgi:phosphate starvation-inducible PhoH-like protein
VKGVAKSRPKAGQVESQLVVAFDDNQLLGALVGEYDRHLVKIEQKLAVHMQSRGNRVVISGKPEATLLAKAVLEDLYIRAKSGLEVTSGDVDGALRMAEATVVLEQSGGEAPPVAGGTKTELKGADAQISIHTRKRYITPRAFGQVEYMRRLQDSDLVFGIGPAGTGKTYLAVAMAISKLLEGSVERIILSRPAVEAGEQLGFLPGNLREKVDPYLRPLFDALNDMLPAEQVEKRFERGEIEVAPLAFMRGRTLSNAFVVLDEAQNTTPLQMKMFLTRFGENCRMVVAGDPTQVDLPAGTRSGLHDAMDILQGIEGVAFVHFTNEDVVRHPLVGRIVTAYDRFAKQSGDVPSGGGSANSYRRRGS